MDNLAEDKFKDWLNKNNILYWYIDQSLESFASASKELSIKRPDFIILIPNLGFILIDIKEKRFAEKHEKIFIDGIEADKYSEMQKKFKMPIWFVSSYKECHYKTWFWIPVSSVLRNGLIFNSSQSGDKAYSVPIKDFIQVADEDNLERIFNKQFMF